MTRMDRKTESAKDLTLGEYVALFVERTRASLTESSERKTDRRVPGE